MVLPPAALTPDHNNKVHAPTTFCCVSHSVSGIGLVAMPDTTHYGCKCDVCGVQPMEGTIYVDRDPIQNFAACESCYNG